MLGNIWSTIFSHPLLNVMILFYHFLGDNLGLAILGVATIIRLAMIPLVKKQTNMTKKMSSLKPELDKLQKKYANNKEKLAEEQVKLYKKVGYNPLGCIGTFIPQIIILSALIGVVRAVTGSNLEGLYPWVRDITGISNGISINTNFLFWDLTKSYKDISTEFGRVSSQALPYIGLSILVGITQYFTSMFTQKMQGISQSKKREKKKDEDTTEQMQKSMQKSTMFLLPLMTAYFTISMPTALGWYWFIQSFLLVLQYLLLDFDKTKAGVQNLWDVLTKKKKK
jgi:YidC/Oxa1 family membrane protein insertase